MDHIDVRHTFANGIRGLLENVFSLPFLPRPYQVESLESVVRWLEDPKGTPRGYISHATGLGKTYLFASMVTAVPDLRVLIVVPTKVLLVQTARVIARYTRGMLGHLSSMSNITDSAGEEVIAVRGMDSSAIVLTTDASFNKHAEKIRETFEPQVILRDECHWGYAEKALTGLESFSEAVIIGFSATPDFLTNSMIGGYTPVRLDNGQVLYGSRDKFADTHFQTCLDRRGLRWGIENGWLAPMAWGRIEFDVSFNDIPVVEGINGPDFDEGKLHQMMQEHWSVMCETIRRLYQNPDYDLPNRQAYAVCPTIKEAEELAEAISSLGISAACITSHTPDAARDVILEAYRNNEIRLITSVMVLREGWDAPNAEVCLMLRPTKSRVLYEQIIGRALRLVDDGRTHKVALILDAHFQGENFSPLSAPSLYAKPGDEVKMNDILIRSKKYRGSVSVAVESPYLPSNAEPKIIFVEEPKIADVLLRADRNGSIIHLDERWGSASSLGRELGIAPGNIKAKSHLLRSIQGRHARGVGVYYAFSDVINVFKEHLRVVPHAQENGSLEHEGEQWSSLDRAAELLGIKKGVITRRLNKTPVRTQDVRNSMNRIWTYYSVSDLRRICADLFQREEPIADNDGFCTLDDEVWGVVNALALHIGVSSASVRHRVETASLEKRDALYLSKPAAMYRLSDIKEVCADIIEELPIIDHEGFVTIEGDLWSTIAALSRALNVSASKIERRVSDSDVKGCVGRLPGGQRADCYPFLRVKSLCEDILESLPQANKSNIFLIEGEEWSTKNTLSTILKISAPTIEQRIGRFVNRYSYGRDILGHRVKIFSVSEVREACSDLLDDLCTADAEGYLHLNEETWGTITSISKKTGLNSKLLAKEVKKQRLSPKKGKLQGGQIKDFYPLHAFECLKA